MMVSPDYENQAHQEQDHVSGGIDSPQSPGRNAAIKLNHEAVTLLMSGLEEDKAMEMLKLGLTYVRYDLVPTAPAPQPSLSSQNRQDERFRFDGMGQRRCAVNETQTFMCRRKDHPERRFMVLSMPMSYGHHARRMPFFNDAAELYLYTNAFSFDPSNFDNSRHSPPSGMIDAEILSATIIYNLALGLTMKAMRTNCSSLLRRSMRLFEVCIQLLRRIIMLPRNDNEELHLPYELAVSVGVACSNNLGQLAFFQCDYELGQSMRRTLQCFLSMYDSLPSIGGRESLSGNASLFSESDLQRFSLNIMFMTYPPTSAASA